jgi:hypothetical protein
MNKLSLSLDQLRVESFDTTPGNGEGRGTVFSEQCTCETACSCPGCPTCYFAGNGNTCEHTCAYEYTCDTCQETCANGPTGCTGNDICMT